MAIEQKIPTPSEIKSTPQVFSENELNEVKTLRTELNQIVIQLGQTCVNKIKLEEQEIYLKTQLSNIEKNEIDLAKKLSDKYGKGSIDLETGTFIPSE